MVFIPGFSRPSPFPNQVPRSPLPTDPLTQFEPGGMPANVLQQLAPPEPLAVTQAMEQGPPISSVQVPEQKLPEIKPQRERRSFLDTIGRLADVLATVGGAEALYQPTLDAREDRARMVDIEAMKRRQMEQQIGAGDEAAADAQRARIGMTMKGLQAIKARGGDVNAAWPLLASRMGLPPGVTAQFADAFSKDPNALDGFSAMFGQEREFGLQPFYAQGADGSLHAYQIGKDGTMQPITLPEGQNPIDPLKFVDTGNQQVGVGSRTGRPIRVLTKGVDPNTGARIASGERIADANIKSRERIAAMKGPGKEGSGGTNDVGEILKDFGIVLDGSKDPVADLIRGSTSGAVQNYASMVPGAFGIATPGKENIGRLETIDNALVLALAGGKLGAGVSNADREFFKEMSGKISDPNVPADVRLAAWDSIKNRLRGIQQREANKQPTAAARVAPSRGGGRPSVSNW